MTPRPETNLLICHGVVSPHARWRQRVVAYGRLVPDPPSSTGSAAPPPPSPGGIEGTLAKFVPNLRRTVMLPGCGHWTQQERVREVNAAMLEFLTEL